MARWAQENVIIASEDARTGAAFFLEAVEPLLVEHKPDLLWIDPALAYLGGEASSQKDVGGFLRNLLNPLLHRHQCGCVVVHHTNKPASGKEKGDWQAGDFAYMGSGSIEWGGWARAVLALRSVGSHSVYELRAGKRGRRLDWKEPDGLTPAYVRMIAHDPNPGVICWREALPEEMPEQTSGKRLPTKEDVLAHVPLNRPIAKLELRDRANGSRVALNRFNALLEHLIEDGQVHEIHQARPGTRPKIMIARGPKPQEELLG